jgi:hypothetical protein
MFALSPQRAWAAWLGAALALVAPALPLARAADQGHRGDEPSQPAEPAFRFTPNMARGMAAIYAREMLKTRYDLPQDKLADAEEMVARRLMQLAHKVDGPAGELAERFIEEELARAGKSDERGVVPPGFGKEFADRMLPLIPELRELARGVVQDVRPMLPMKGQLQMAGEMMAFKAAVDGFETQMKKWSSGEVTQYDDPFRQQRIEKKNDKGETADLRWARQSAQEQIEQPRAKRWSTYLDNFKRLYQLDAAQAATGESILREYTDREKAVISDPGWAQRVYRDQLWMNMSYRTPAGWMHPARSLLEDDLAAAKAPVDRLDEEFKTRLETIPTQAQRRGATDRVAGLLKNKGLQISTTQLSSGTEPKP